MAKKFLEPIDMNSNNINNVLDPILTQDAATKNYVDIHTLLGNNDTISINTTLTAGYSVVYVRQGLINSGIKFSIKLGARVRVI
jgi:hypothetical protein